MRTKDFVEIEKRLPPELVQGFTTKGRLLFVSPFERTLRGFLFEPSAFNATDFYVNMFFLPLCVPVKHIHLTFGHRLGTEKRWTGNDPDLIVSLSREMKHEIPSLLALEGPERVVEAIEPFTKRPNPHCREAFAYTLIQAGRTEAAMSALDTLLALTDRSVAWQIEIAGRAMRIQEMLARGIEEATEQLAAWESETIAQLGLAQRTQRGTLEKPHAGASLLRKKPVT